MKSKVIVLIKDNIKAYVTDVTSVVQEGINLHKTSPLSSLVLATAITNLGTLGPMKKYGNISAIIKGDGPIKTIIVESNTDGDIRAFVSNPSILSEYDKEKYNTIPLQLGIGTKGTLKIVNEVNGQTFGGEVSLAKGDIVTDLSYYFDQSEQINSAVQSSIELSKPNKIKKAFGVIFQMLPQHSEKDILLVEKLIKENSISKFNSIDEYIKFIDFAILEEKELRWKCSCSQEKVNNLLKIISNKEKEKIINEHGQLETICSFCNKSYILKS